MLGWGTGICGECSCDWGILGEIWGMVLRGKGWWAGGLRGVLGASLEGGWVLRVLLEVWDGASREWGVCPQDGNKILVPAQVQGCRHSSPSAIHIPLFIDLPGSPVALGHAWAVTQLLERLSRKNGWHHFHWS